MTLTTARSTPLTNAAADTWTAHTDKLGPLPAADAGHLLRAVSDSGLIGRGGAGFPTGRKLATVAAGRRPVVIGNGAEGEPASAKDRYLLYTAPHLVLDGLQLAARITGAKTAYLYAPQTVLNRTVEPALKQRHDDVRIRLVASPDAFLSGEESAVVAAVQGRPAIPTSTPPRVFERGVGGRPTVVQNVESLAHIALIARFGPDWFRGQGTPDEPGTRLMTVSGAVRRPGVHEVSGGSSLEHVLARAGGISEPVSAVLVGGYHGGWVPYLGTDAPVALSRESLARYGAAPGAGVVMALARSGGGGAGRPPPTSSATCPDRARANAGRVAMACPRSPPPCTSWPTVLHLGYRWPRSSDCPHWSPIAGHVTTRAEPSAWSAARCRCSQLKSRSTCGDTAVPPEPQMDGDDDRTPCRRLDRL
jgi:hypothetical protein